VAAPAFERFILRRDDSLRGRGPDEVTSLLHAGLRAAGVSEDAISVIPDEQDAVTAALRMGEPRDLLVIFGDNITRCWKQIIRFGGGEVRSPSATGIGNLVAAPAAAPAAAPVEDETVEPVRDERPLAASAQQDVIVDERGVRLAREESD
jgi:cyanophycin synthetase